jgi:hypothetical protein
MIRLIKLILLPVIFSVGSVCAGAGGWHVPDAEYRIRLRVGGRRTPSTFVRLPLEFQDWKGVSCFGKNGKVAFRPVVVGGKLLAVEINSNKPSSESVYVYPSKVPSKLVAGASALPILRTYQGIRQVHNRPFCSSEDRNRFRS